jgi:hypothetical protein
MKHRKSRFFQVIIFLNSLIVLIFWIYPSFSHTNHPHQPVKTEVSPQPINENTASQTQTKINNIPSNINTQPQNNADAFFIPKTSEILGFVLIVNPFLLYTLRKKLHHLKK